MIRSKTCVLLCVISTYLLVFVSGDVVVESPDNDIDEDMTTITGGRRLQQQRYSPGYVAATLADAYADVLRAKAQKYNKTEVVSSTPTAAVLAAAAVPQKSKNFAYTNIRLTTAASGVVPAPPPPPPLLETTAIVPPLVTQQQQVPPVVVSGPRQTTTQSPLVTNPAAVTTPPTTVQQSPLVTQSASQAAPTSPEVQKKLAELDLQLQQLKELQAQLEALKSSSSTPPATTHTSTAYSSGRRLLDSGAPGWDAGVLFEKKLDILQNQITAIQNKLASDAAALQLKLSALSDDAVGSLGTIQDYQSNKMIGNTDLLNAVVDTWRERAETNAGNLQDALLRMMEYKSQSFSDMFDLWP